VPSAHSGGKISNSVNGPNDTALCFDQPIVTRLLGAGAQPIGWNQELIWFAQENHRVGPAGGDFHLPFDNGDANLVGVIVPSR
jgi:hypothetical protein